MEREVAWKKYDEASLDELEALAVDYIDFISENKTERECAAAAIAAAADAGYDSLADCIAAGTPVGPGSKLWACAQGKAVILISSELPEVLGMSDRVLVVKDDAIVAELTGDEINAVEVMRYAL